MLRHLVNKLKILFFRNKVINFEMNLKFDSKSNKNTKKISKSLSLSLWRFLCC